MIDVGRCFVDDEYLILSQQGTCEAYELPLTDAEVRSTFGHLLLQTIEHVGFQLHLE